MINPEKVFNSDNSYLKLACPVCGGDYTHVREAYARTGTDSAESKIYQGESRYRGVENNGVTNDRGNALCIGVEGECGHNFNIIFQQSKGVELISIELRNRG